MYIYITLYYFILITYTMSINIPSKNQFLQRQKTSRAGRVVWLRCHPVYMAARATGDRQQAAFDITHPKNWETSRFPSVIVIELLSPVAWEGDVPWIFHLRWFKNRSRGNYASEQIHGYLSEQTSPVGAADLNESGKAAAHNTPGKWQGNPDLLPFHLSFQRGQSYPWGSDLLSFGCYLEANTIVSFPPITWSEWVRFPLLSLWMTTNSPFTSPFYNTEEKWKLCTGRTRAVGDMFDIVWISMDMVSDGVCVCIYIYIYIYI